MKKLLFLVVFIGTLSISTNTLSAQSTARESMTSSQKSDDGVMVAYPLSDNTQKVTQIIKQ